jgi:hypothetical protein
MGGISLAKGVRKPADKAIEDRMVQLRRHDARTVGRIPDLLLVMPAFGELPRGIEPVEGSRFSGPTYVEHRRREGVKRFVEVGALATGHLHHVCQNRRAEAAIDADAFAV